MTTATAANWTAYAAALKCQNVRDDRDALEAAGIAYAEMSKRCRRCGRVLTVPTSLHRGFGPDCWEIVNG
jgi:hypothetical protein